MWQGLSLVNPSFNDVGTSSLWKETCALVSLFVVGKVVWDHYSILLYPRVPYHDLGWPVIGHSFRIFRKSLDVWRKDIMAGKRAVLSNFLYGHVVLVDYSLYLERIHRAELDGKLRPLWSPSTMEVLGKSSILSLPAGKGHPHHKRLRAKILSSLAPKPVLAVQGQLKSLIRQVLDDLVTICEKKGHVTFQSAASHIAARGSTLQITAGLEPKLQARLEELLDIMIEGIFAFPINLGRFSSFGRAMLARKEVSQIVEGLLKQPNLSCQNILYDLSRSGQDGEAFTLEEMVDTVGTLLLAGKLTTADALPNLLIRLHENTAWKETIAQEQLEFCNIEEDSATLRFVRESLRVEPPVTGYRRGCDEELSLGSDGSIPPGCSFAVLIKGHLQGMGSDFDPDRWNPALSRNAGWLPFGGAQPHSCVGKNLALLELQLFARILCREYEFEALNPELVVVPSKPNTRVYKDGLRIRIKQKATV